MEFAASIIEGGSGSEGVVGVGERGNSFGACSGEEAVVDANGSGLAPGRTPVFVALSGEVVSGGEAKGVGSSLLERPKPHRLKER